MKLPRQEYWSGLPFPPAGNLPLLGIKPMSPALQAVSLPLCHHGSLYVPLLPLLSPQSCPTLCNPIDCSPPGSSVHGILQARILEWVAMPSSKGSSQPRGRTWVSCIAGRCFTTEPPRKPPYVYLFLPKFLTADMAIKPQGHHLLYLL